MRSEFVLAGAVMAMGVGVSVAGSDGCCDAPAPIPRVVYALPPTPTAILPTGYVLDPSDAMKPAYGYGYGYGPPAYGPPAYDPPGPGYYRGLYVRPAGAPPYTAYRYRVAPSAKIIHLRPSE
jgi:hypothetical protein